MEDCKLLTVTAALLLLGVAAVLTTSTGTTSSQESASLTHNGTFECDLSNSSSCDEGQCCVKKVSWRLEDDQAGVEVSTECQDLLTAGKLCLVKPQGYLCDCGPGLVCRTKKNEDFGHCAKA